ncbi:hypothetical protein SAMD00019534_018380, partial [Acytostelium subglobosum LB1]|uniref:hypothetical protein n=1 Tax=Acytostelium subglobosum LB1 TaxID=1410327 RepID=UPI000644D8C1
EGSNSKDINLLDNDDDDGVNDISKRLRTQDVISDSNIDFSEMMLSKEVLEGLAECGFLKPSPIQVHAIPLGLSGSDLIAQAKSGTGKTAVFGIIALELILKHRNLQPTSLSREQLLDLDDETYAEAVSGVPRRPMVLILAPTREIAVQSRDVINQIGRTCKYIKAEAFIGGLREADDRARLSGVQIIVGTPGRVRSLIESLALRTDDIKLLVLDEADKLLDAAFAKDFNWLHNSLSRMKSLLLILDQVAFYQAIVFCNSKTRAEELCRSLTRQGWPTKYIAGAMDQRDRLAIMSDLKEFRLRVLVSTDLISRGIDIERVNLVVNMDVPNDFETYFHRIGRTGRFGSYGVAITFLSQEEKMFFVDLQSLYPVKLQERKDNDIIPEEYYTYQLTEESETKSLEALKEKQNKLAQHYQNKEKQQRLDQERRKLEDNKDPEEYEDEEEEENEEYEEDEEEEEYWDDDYQEEEEIVENEDDDQQGEEEEDEEEDDEEEEVEPHGQTTTTQTPTTWQQWQYQSYYPNYNQHGPSPTSTSTSTNKTTTTNTTATNKQPPTNWNNQQQQQYQYPYQYGYNDAASYYNNYNSPDYHNQYYQYFYGQYQQPQQQQPQRQQQQRNQWPSSSSQTTRHECNCPYCPTKLYSALSSTAPTPSTTLGGNSKGMLYR